MFPANLGIIYNYIYYIYIYPNLDPNKKVVKKTMVPLFGSPRAWPSAPTGLFPGKRIPDAAARLETIHWSIGKAMEPAGKQPHDNGQSPCLMVKSTINGHVQFNRLRYVKLPEGM